MFYWVEVWGARALVGLGIFYMMILGVDGVRVVVDDRNGGFEGCVMRG